MELFQALIGFFAALPEIMKLVVKIASWLQGYGFENVRVLIRDIDKAFEGLKLAQTTEERQNAAKAIADIIARLPRR